MNCEKKNKISLERALIVLILILCFVASYGDIVFRRTGTNTFAENIYKISVCTIWGLCNICLLLHILLFKRIDRFIIHIVLYLIYETVITLAFYVIHPIDFIIHAYTWPLVFVAAYLIGLTDDPDVLLKPISILGIAVTYILVIPNLKIHLTGVGMYGGVIGPLYYLISYLALIFLLCRNNTKLLFTIFISLIMVFSAKRTGVLCMGIGIAGYYYCETYIRAGKNKYKGIFFAILATMFIVLGVSWYLQTHNLLVFSRFLEAREDQGSGRILAWRQVIDKFQKSSLKYKILGHGFHTVQVQVRPLGREIYAHNSFLETLYDNGIIGLAVLIYVVMRMLRFMMRLIREKDAFAPIIVYLMIVALLFSIVGGYFFDESRIILPVAFIWGMIKGLYNKRNIKINSVARD